uniref:Sema domain-containing protein n=1 Tax=Macrostomum lignano TaxID=282301 RepID=A0A1I8F5L3_9PLAT
PQRSYRSLRQSRCLLAEVSRPGRQAHADPEGRLEFAAVPPPAFQLMNGTQVLCATSGRSLEDIGIGFAVVPFIGLVGVHRYRPSFSRQTTGSMPARSSSPSACPNFAGSFVSSYPVTGSFTRLGC